MTKMTLYTGRGVSYSPEYADGRTESDYVRLVADEGMGITDGVIVATVIDTNDPVRWTDCELPEEPESATAEEILDILLGGET
jgi:hypothetical protein